VTDRPAVYPFAREYARDGGPADGEPRGPYRRRGHVDRAAPAYPAAFRPDLYLDPKIATRLLYEYFREAKRIIRDSPGDAAKLIDLDFASMARRIESCDWRDTPDGGT
jgi:hypothetical protein